MNKISILDCTLRDGGYINNWDFTNDNINNIVKSLVLSNVEQIEFGFISQPRAWLIVLFLNLLRQLKPCCRRLFIV